jgi:hypothetical protein
MRRTPATVTSVAREYSCCAPEIDRLVLRQRRAGKEVVTRSSLHFPLLRPFLVGALYLAAVLAAGCVATQPPNIKDAGAVDAGEGVLLCGSPRTIRTAACCCSVTSAGYHRSPSRQRPRKSKAGSGSSTWPPPHTHSGG